MRAKTFRRATTRTGASTRCPGWTQAGKVRLAYRPVHTEPLLSYDKGGIDPKKIAPKAQGLLTMALAAAGYSGTPLAAKLGLKDGMAACFVALPPTLEELASAVGFLGLDRATGLERRLPGCSRPSAPTTSSTPSRASAPRSSEHLADLQDALKVDGMIWVSWPKKASKVATDVTEDVIRAEALKLDLVDVKVAAVDEVWSGLKLVIRKDRR